MTRNSVSLESRTNRMTRNSVSLESKINQMTYLSILLKTDPVPTSGSTKANICTKCTHTSSFSNKMTTSKDHSKVNPKVKKKKKKNPVTFSKVKREEDQQYPQEIHDDILSTATVLVTSVILVIPASVCLTEVTRTIQASVHLTEATTTVTTEKKTTILVIHQTPVGITITTENRLTTITLIITKKILSNHVPLVCQ